MNRRDMLKLSSYAVAAASAPALAESAANTGTIARWDHIEIALPGPSAGNPFLDVTLSAVFRFKHRTVTVPGFYDGAGKYKIRFMPDELGAWAWTTASNAPALNGQSGAFQCIAPAVENHGPVSVRDTFHFGYADGAPFVECGTTCYANTALREGRIAAAQQRRHAARVHTHHARSRRSEESQCKRRLHVRGRRHRHRRP